MNSVQSKILQLWLDSLYFRLTSKVADGEVLVL